MKKLVIHSDKIDAEARQTLLKICPFHAFAVENGQLSVTAGCKMCGICVRKGPPGAITLEEVQTQALAIDKTQWRGIAVFADLSEGSLHPVTLELLGKARQLADSIDHPVYALLIGYQTGGQAEQLLDYGADEVFTYDDPRLADFLIEPYTAAAADFIRKVKPSALLVGATLAGRSLAPRIAARFRTGLTADCTALEIKPNTDLVQIRPAFGGNIMARIVTRNNRPQLCTVRYKVFNAPSRLANAGGKITPMQRQEEDLRSRVKLLGTTRKDTGIDLTAAEVIIAVGRGVKSKKDLALIEALADRIGAKMACTRPLVENGWFDPRRQIGLSGRTVSPRLIITVGISGSVQFVAGMKGAEMIIAINIDPQAGIFNVAHHAFVGDWYEILPRLVEEIDQSCRPATAAGL
ncbi:MAG TPA: electron transfer flavoprotein subunit alpha [Clostridiales bacterium]|nr:electron transfer flavoprotein subunit alpha [Clostridiales bacterium]